jgi:hypothetical protein
MTLYAQYGADTTTPDARVRIATTVNDSLSGLAARDGITPVAGDRVLVKNHATGASKGLYVAAAGAWSRAADLPAGAHAAGLLVVVEEGAVNADTRWMCTNDLSADTVGTDALTFATPTIGSTAATNQSATTGVTAADPGHTHTLPAATDAAGTGASGAPSASVAVGSDTHTHTAGALTGDSGAPSATTAVGTDTHTHTAGAITGATGGGSSHNHAFTGTTPTTGTTPHLTGSGYATAGQVVTTTDNQTVALNELAGMWLICATKAPCLIDSHPAAAAAPLVLTVFGAAPATTAEDYRVLRAPTPAGSNAAEAAHTHDQGTLAGAASGAPSATVAVGSSTHTHNQGTLAGAASGAPSATTTVGTDTHTHTGPSHTHPITGPSGSTAATVNVTDPGHNHTQDAHTHAITG